MNNFQGFGNYFQNFSAKIVIGRGTYIAPNVGIITVNHNLKNLDKHLPGKDVVISEKCWIGMNCHITGCNSRSTDHYRCWKCCHQKFS